MDISLVLTRKFPGSEWVVRGGRLEWLSDGPAPSEAELTALWPTVEAEIVEERQAKEDARLSAIAKLEALGLTVDEVSAAFGLEA